jgi:hypothetical protein
MKPNVELHIEKLILHGLESCNRHQIAQAMEHELAFLLAERGVPPSLAQGGDVAHLDGGSFTIVSGASAGEVGTQVARTVYRGFSRRA